MIYVCLSEERLSVESRQDSLVFFLIEIRVSEDLQYFFPLVNPSALIVDHLNDLLLNALIFQFWNDLFEFELCLRSSDYMLKFIFPQRSLQSLLVVLCHSALVSALCPSHVFFGFIVQLGYFVLTLTYLSNKFLDLCLAFCKFDRRLGPRFPWTLAANNILDWLF